MNALSLRSPGLTALKPCPRRATAATRRAAPAPVRAMFGGGGKGGGGGNPLANLGGLMENMKKAQEEAAKVQKELSEAEFEGFSIDETVRFVMSGSQEPKGVDITNEAYAQGATKLEKLVFEAAKDAHAKSVMGMKERMTEMAQSLGLGGPGGGLGL